MENFIAIIHVLTALTLIALVLLQDSKGGGLGGALGGGGSNSILGATGASTLAQKLTRGAAIVFAITSIGLTMAANRRTSVVDDLPASSVGPAIPGTQDPTGSTMPADPNAPAGTPTAPPAPGTAAPADAAAPATTPTPPANQ